MAEVVCDFSFQPAAFSTPMNTGQRANHGQDTPAIHDAKQQEQIALATGNCRPAKDRVK
jgi:hypothetical protein